MRAFNLLVFDDFISGTGVRYGMADLAEQIGRADGFTVGAIVSSVGAGATGLTVQAEHCCDGRSWIATPAPEISASGILDDRVYFGSSSPWNFALMASVRFKINLSGATPSCRLKLYVTGRTTGGAS